MTVIMKLLEKVAVGTVQVGTIQSVSDDTVWGKCHGIIIIGKTTLLQDKRRGGTVADENEAKARTFCVCSEALESGLQQGTLGA